jgi:DNA-binding NarL/FixJ family response regulator
MEIRVLIYEDNHPLREALTILVEGMSTLKFVGAYGDCLSVEEQVLSIQPDVILMDIDLPGRSGIEATRIIKEVYPRVEILILSVFEDDDKIFDAVCVGASGYLLKKTPPSVILEAIEEVHRGGAPMTPMIARKILRMVPREKTKNPIWDELTTREKEVLESLAKGNSYKMVATELQLSIDTIRTYVRKIYQKLHVHSIAEALAKTYLKK